MIKKFKIQNSKFKFKENGFTLVEMLIYMGLMSFLLIILTDIFVSILDLKSESQAVSAVEQDGRYIGARLMYDINRAGSITIPASLGETSNSLTLNISGETYGYSLQGGNLVLTNSLGSNNLNSSETLINSPVFQKIGNPGGKATIKIQYTVESVTQRKTGPEIKTFETVVGLR